MRTGWGGAPRGRRSPGIAVRAAVAAFGAVAVGAAAAVVGSGMARVPPAGAAAAPSSVPGALLPGQTLRSGQRIESANGEYRLAMWSNGDLVESSGATVLWSSRSSVPGSKAVMQDDGNLVVYPPVGPARWTSATSGHPGSYLSLEDDGEAVIGAGGATWWADGASRLWLRAGSSLPGSWSLMSPNGLFELLMQRNGDLVEYLFDGGDGQALWGVDTGVAGAVARVRPDGSFAVTSPSGAALWRAPAGRAGQAVRVLDDGDVALLDGGRVLWSSRTAGHRTAIVTAAASQLGYQDNPSGTYCNPYSAYWGAGVACGGALRSEEWCADFAAWTWRQAGVPFTYGWYPGDLSASAASFYAWAVAHGTWHPAGSGYRPRPGDAAVYGLDASGTYADHVAIVVVAGRRGPDVVNGDWWPDGDGAVVAQADETTATGTDRLSGYASPVGGSVPIGAAASASIDAPLRSRAGRGPEPDALGLTGPAPGATDGLRSGTYVGGRAGDVLAVAVTGPTTFAFTLDRLGALGSTRRLEAGRGTIAPGGRLLLTGPGGPAAGTVLHGEVTLRLRAAPSAPLALEYHGDVP